MRCAILVLAYLFLGLLAAPVLIFCMLFGLRETFITYGVWMMEVGRRVLGIDIEATGLDRLDPKTPFVFMCNHLSFLDGPLFMTVLDRPVRAIVKKFVFRTPVLGLGMWFSGYVALDREGAGAGRKSIARAARLIKERGYSFLIFPEGTRSWDGKAMPFRRGGFYLALECGVPIVPVSIQGTYELMPRDKWMIRGGPVRIVFHEPIPVAGYTPENMAGLMERVKAAVLSAD